MQEQTQLKIVLMLASSFFSFSSFPSINGSIQHASADVDVIYEKVFFFKKSIIKFNIQYLFMVFHNLLPTSKQRIDSLDMKSEISLAYALNIHGPPNGYQARFFYWNCSVWTGIYSSLKEQYPVSNEDERPSDFCMFLNALLVFHIFYFFQNTCVLRFSNNCSKYLFEVMLLVYLSLSLSCISGACLSAYFLHSLPISSWAFTFLFFL